MFTPNIKERRLWCVPPVHISTLTYLKPLIPAPAAARAMLVTPYIRLLFLGLLATFVPLVDAKGGGGHGGGKSSSKGSSKPKTKITKTIVYTGGSGHTECRDELT